MGNSCLKPRAVTWLDDDDDEEDLEQLEVFKRKRREEKRRSDKYSSSETTVKIKITKRQLEEILRLSTKKELPMELLLSSFVNSNSNTVFCSDKIMSKWRPRLQTIAEQDHDEQSNGTTCNVMIID